MRIHTRKGCMHIGHLEISHPAFEPWALTTAHATGPWLGEETLPEDISRIVGTLGHLPPLEDVSNPKRGMTRQQLWLVQAPPGCEQAPWDVIAMATLSAMEYGRYCLQVQLQTSAHGRQQQ
ncbi:hypothetical protein Vretimale_2098 [Volvox reticuliferus]|nr:hypothetical protein Vretimale_2098 [Volvox reticuliferus]